jgi:hypothetical protein
MGGYPCILLQDANGTHTIPGVGHTSAYYELAERFVSFS